MKNDNPPKPAEVIQIRIGAFETNSSSSHSLTISKKGNYSTKLPIQDFYKPEKGPAHLNCLVLTGSDYGWGYEKHSDPYSKANYIATFLKTEASSYLDKKTHKKYLDMFEKVMRKETGIQAICYDVDDAYIDHQSVECAEDAFVSEDDLRHFIFNSASVLYIDNDNH